MTLLGRVARRHGNGALIDVRSRRHVFLPGKGPLLSPPTTLNPEPRLSPLVQETLRASTLASMPFFDRSKVIALLERLPTMDERARIANDQVLMLRLSTCVLHERLRLAA